MVYPFSRAWKQASRICHGVTKSGSPTPKDMTPCICEARSKNFLIPDGGTDLTTFETYFSMLLTD